MPYTSEIVSKINSVIGFGLSIPDAVFLGIAYSYPELQGTDTLIKIVPAIIDKSTGEGAMIDINDAYALKLYHRLITNTYTHQPAKYGSSYTQKWTADMHLIVIAMRAMVQVTAEDLEQKIVKLIPQSVVLNSPAGVSNLQIFPYQSDMDFITVFRDEFRQVDYFLKPEQILFKIRYRITADVDPKCLV